jgi:hypothetical protein
MKNLNNVSIINKKNILKYFKVNFKNNLLNYDWNSDIIVMSEKFNEIKIIKINNDCTKTIAVSTVNKNWFLNNESRYENIDSIEITKEEFNSIESIEEIRKWFYEQDFTFKNIACLGKTSKELWFWKFNLKREFLILENQFYTITDTCELFSYLWNYYNKFWEIIHWQDREDLENYLIVNNK